MSDIIPTPAVQPAPHKPYSQRRARRRQSVKASQVWLGREILLTNGLQCPTTNCRRKLRGEFAEAGHDGAVRLICPGCHHVIFAYGWPRT